MREFNFRIWDDKRQCMAIYLDHFLYIDGELSSHNDKGQIMGSLYTQGQLGDFKLMQWTGEYDVYGESIFEGDIVESIPRELGEEYIKGQVVFLEGMFVIEDGTKAMKVFHETMEFRKLGNIFENPELLKQ